MKSPVTFNIEVTITVPARYWPAVLEALCMAHGERYKSHADQFVHDGDKFDVDGTKIALLRLPTVARETVWFFNAVMRDAQLCLYPVNNWTFRKAGT